MPFTFNSFIGYSIEYIEYWAIECIIHFANGVNRLFRARGRCVIAHARGAARRAGAGGVHGAASMRSTRAREPLLTCSCITKNDFTGDLRK